MNRGIVWIFFTFIFSLSQNALATPGPLFQVTSLGGPPEPASIVLCLNGNGPLSCQHFEITSLDVLITPTVPNHYYPAIGIKIDNPGYQIQGCTNIGNGYCIFPASSTSPVNLHLTKVQYDVVFDAGSSGTRVYVYQTTTTAGASNPVIETVFSKRGGQPLASCAVNTEACVKSTIQPLLDEATAVLEQYHVPPEQVPASVLGTAGMRLLPENTQQKIYGEVDVVLRENHYILGETATITGQYEGLYQWLNINYETDTLGLPYTSTYGTIEIGGASAQVAFVSTLTSPNTNVIPLSINGQSYPLYSISFLGLGQNEARASMNALPAPNPNYCYPVGYNVGSIVGNFMSGISTPPGCSPNYDTVISQFTNPSLPDVASVPGFTNQSYYGLSSIYGNLNFLGVTPNPTPSSVSSAINTICANTYAQLQVLYPNQFQLYNACADSSFDYSFLYASTGLNLGSIPVISDNISAAFTLGFVYSRNKTPNIMG